MTDLYFTKIYSGCSAEMDWMSKGQGWRLLALTWTMAIAMEVF